MPQTRRLAAIMFTDIVGYTAMMQENEAEGITKAQAFRQVMQTQVEAHHGELLEIRGDGSLSVFNSAVDAVACAKKIQELLREQVPIRIGIHLGDIVQNEDHIFGDAVNIASRIESMGVAGSVLVSSNVRNQIKNKPEFELTTLGQFSFKNVGEKMEVYALANEGFLIPKRNQLKGKFSTSSKTGWEKVLLLALILTIILGIAGIWWQKTKASKDFEISESSIAVLPFRDLSPKQDQEYFCDGVAEEIQDALSKLQNLKVAGRVSSFSFKNKPDISISEIGEQLHVSTILSGSIRKQGEKIRVSANLINVEDGFEIWSENYDLELKDIFAIQEKIAQNIAEKFRISSSQNLITKKSTNPEAYEHYLKGNFFLNKAVDGAFQAQEEYELSIKHDSTFLPAYTALANVYWVMGLYGLASPSEAGKKIKEICEKTLKIDPDNGDAYYQLSSYEMYYNWNWELAIEYDLKAQELGYKKRKNTIIECKELVFTGKGELADEIIQNCKDLLQKDPLSLEALLNLNRAFLFAQKYDQVIENSKKIFDLTPNQRSAMRHIGEAYLFSDRPEQALPYFERAIQSTNYTFNDYILCLVKLNRKEEAKAKFEEVKADLSPWLKAHCHIALGELNWAFKELDKCIETKGPFVLFYKLEPHYDPIRSDPRFKTFEEKIGFPSAKELQMQ